MHVVIDYIQLQPGTNPPYPLVFDEDEPLMAGQLTKFKGKKNLHIVNILYYVYLILLCHNIIITFHNHIIINYESKLHCIVVLRYF